MVAYYCFNYEVSEAFLCSTEEEVGDREKIRDSSLCPSCGLIDGRCISPLVIGDKLLTVGILRRD